MKTIDIAKFVEQSRRFMGSPEASGVVIGATVKLARFRKAVRIIEQLLDENAKLREKAWRYDDLSK